MNIFGVGPLELVVVLVFALLVLGPEGMVKAGRTLGRFMRRLTTSEFWQAVQGSGDLLGKLSRDLGFSEDFEKIQSDLYQAGLPNLNDIERYKSEISNADPPPTQSRKSPSETNQEGNVTEESSSFTSNGNGKENES